jgi:hypothetical protein
MSALNHLSSLLTQRPIVLVVEDRITKEYLVAAWGAEEQFFTIIVAGGHRVVDGFVNDFRRHDQMHVFGLLDRDFGITNQPRWRAPSDSPTVLRLPRHELENYLLDWDALAGCELNKKCRNRTTTDIEARGKSEATKQPWWLACRGQLHEIQKALGKDFPVHPTLGSVTSDQSALDVITQSPWFAEMAPRLATACDDVALKSNIQATGARYSAQLSCADWLQDFSGKEIFAILQSYVYTSPGKNNPEPEVELARSIGAWQFANGRVPADIQELKEALKQRVKLA